MNSKEIQNRIKGVKNTKQITKAMEMVAASKMRKAIERVLTTRPYANLAWEMLNNLSGRVHPELHPLLKERKIKKICVVLITSDRGLCGAMNTQVIQKAIKIIEEENAKILEQENEEMFGEKKSLLDKQKLEIEFITVGKKGQDFIKKYFKISAGFTGLESVSSLTEIIPIVKIIIEDYQKEIYDKIILVYTDFVSILEQKPKMKQLLPLQCKNFQEASDKKKSLEQIEINTIPQFEYKFEPSPDEILQELLPKLLEIQLYQSMLESNASEHCSRMVTMKNATDAAKDLIDNLSMIFNQARQASITQEIIEISTGAQFI
ncbi:MAG: FoF1 ATP synthase subunit gamma [Patescibacteria group bacterium]